jgi:SAM-dependent methyltransferase
VGPAGDGGVTINDPTMVAREYETLDRLRKRRCDVTGWLRFGGDDEVTQMQSALREVHPRRVLDAGCGEGWIASTIAAPELVCVDRSEAAVEAARARGLDARVADVESLPFADGDFDAVMCNNVLYHVPDRDRALAELARVLRPGGRFVGIYGFADHLQELWDAIGDPWDPDDFGCASGAELERHFARVECRPAGGAVLWETREDLQEYLDAFVEMVGALAAPDRPYPFVATRHKCVLVADKA